jgi:ferredoxin
MAQTVTVTFLDPETSGPLAKRTVPYGSTVLDAALEAGIDITATCGRRGRCRSCRVKAIAGEIAPPT